MIRRRKFLFMIVACVVVAMVSGIVPLNYAHKLSHGCPVSHKVKAKTSPCFHDTVTSSFSDLNAIADGPASGPTSPVEVSVRTAQVPGLWSFAANMPVEGPPLRC